MEEIKDIEEIVNEQILLNTELDVSVQKFDDAKKAGAEALFGEKYGDEVRVVQVGDYSMELCGGTHVARTGDIGSFKITEESSLSSGVRRIVAVTGKKAVSEMQSNASILLDLQSLLNTPPKGMVERIKGLFKEKKDLEKKLKDRASQPSHGNLMNEAKKIGDHYVLVKEVQVSSMDELKMIGDNVFNKLSSGIVVLLSQGEEKPMAVIVVSKNLNEEGILAGKLAKDIGGFMEGGGGGKPHLATAGGKNNSSIKLAVDSTQSLINELFNG